MPDISNTYRRGPVYYWRRWTPGPCRILIQLSLAVKDRPTAFALSMALSADSVTAFARFKAGLMDRAALEAYLAIRLAHHRSHMRSASARDWRDAAKTHVSRGLAHLLVAKRGAKAGLREFEARELDLEFEDDVARQALREIGQLLQRDAHPATMLNRAAEAHTAVNAETPLNHAMNALAIDHLAAARVELEAARAYGYREDLLDRLIKETGAVISLPSLNQSGPTLGEALRQARRAFHDRFMRDIELDGQQDPTPEGDGNLDNILDQILALDRLFPAAEPTNALIDMLEHLPPEAPLFFEDEVDTSNPQLDAIDEAHDMLLELSRRPAKPEAEPIAVPPTPMPPTAVPGQQEKPGQPAEKTIEALGEQLADERNADGEWTAHTAKQARSTYRLFGRFLDQTHQVQYFWQLSQAHLDAYRSLLRDLHKCYGKSGRDKDRTIAELLVIARKKPKEQRGLDPNTVNRHFTHLGDLLRRARSAGLTVDRELALSELRAKKKVRARDEREIPNAPTVDRFFEAPVFTGAKGLYGKNLALPGTMLFHRAAYFIPIMAYYTGARREELCGLLTEDVITDNGPLPYLHLAPNDIRGLKNLQSTRNVVLHPEIVRLGFLDYVKAIAAAGYGHVFPDLVNPHGNKTLGDRLYNDLKSTQAALGITTHQFRHLFNNGLKQKRVSDEFRADMMGHGGKTETTERYCDPIELQLQLEDILKLPEKTGHLAPRPIKLLGWVKHHGTPPWHRAAKGPGQGPA